MTTRQEVKALIGDLGTADQDVLAETARRAREIAQAKGLLVLPASLDIDAVVVLDEDHVTVEQAIEAAGTAASALVYLNQSTVNAAALLPAIRARCAEDQRDELSSAVSRIDGWTSQVEIGFAHAGQLVVWAVVSDWFDALESLAGPRSSRLRSLTLTEHDVDGEDHDRPSVYPAEDQRPVYLSDDVVEQWTMTLAADPGFRRAANSAGRATAARAVSGLSEVLDNREQRWQGQQIIATASHTVREEAERQAEKLGPQMAELAAELARDPEYIKIGTAAVKKRYVSEWMIDRAGGLCMPGWCIGELIALAKKSPAGQLTL